MRSQASRRPSFLSARAIDARVAWMTPERSGSGGKGNGLLLTRASRSRSESSPCSLSSSTWAAKRDAPTPSPVYPAA